MKANTTTSRKMFRPARLAAVIATLAFGASASCFAAVAGAGEAQDIALPNMRVAPATVSTAMSTSDVATITREQVRSELMAAQADGTMAVPGEIGDNSSTVLAARNAANERQAETIIAAYQVEQDRLIALQREEELRAQIALQESIDAWASAGFGGDEAYVPGGSGDEPVDTSAVRIDVIRMTEIGAMKPEEELVVVSMEGGDETSQLDQAAAIRRQLGEMGLAQEQVYIEAAPERD